MVECDITVSAQEGSKVVCLLMTCFDRLLFSLHLKKRPLMDFHLVRPDVSHLQLVIIGGCRVADDVTHRCSDEDAWMTFPAQPLPQSDTLTSAEAAVL